MGVGGTVGGGVAVGVRAGRAVPAGLGVSTSEVGETSGVVVAVSVAVAPARGVTIAVTVNVAVGLGNSVGVKVADGLDVGLGATVADGEGVAVGSDGVAACPTWKVCSKVSAPSRTLKRQVPTGAEAGSV